jgi:hypothetical protein
VDQPHVTKIIEEEPVEDKPKENEDLLNLLPKTYRSRAKVILHYLLPNIKLNDNKQVVFSDGTVSAHILDYLRYVINPMRMHAPVDIAKFMALMNNLGVPKTVYSNHVIYAKDDDNWLTFQ